MTSASESVVAEKYQSCDSSVQLTSLSTVFIMTRLLKKKSAMPDSFLVFVTFVTRMDAE